MTILYLIRHAVTGIMELEQKPTDPLNGDGHHEAQQLAHRLKSYPIDLMYSSTMERARETAALIAKFHQGKEVKEAPLFDEIEIFNKEGKVERFMDFAPHLEEIKNICEKEQGKNIAIVTHGNFIRGILTEILEARERVIPRLKIRTASITTVAYENHQFQILGVNDICHLQ